MEGDGRLPGFYFYATGSLIAYLLEDELASIGELSFEEERVAPVETCVGMRGHWWIVPSLPR